MKVKMLATGNVEEIAAGFAQRLYEAGQAVFVKDPAKAEVVVRDKLPEEDPSPATQDDTQEKEETVDAVEAETGEDPSPAAQDDKGAKWKNAKGRKSK